MARPRKKNKKARSSATDLYGIVANKRVKERDLKRLLEDLEEEYYDEGLENEGSG